MFKIVIANKLFTLKYKLIDYVMKNKKMRTWMTAYLTLDERSNSNVLVNHG